MESTGAHDVQVPRLAALPGVQRAYVVDLRTIFVFRMRIRCHVAPTTAVVHEEHTRPLRDGELLRVDAAGGDRECEWVDGRRRCRRRVAASAAAGGQPQNQRHCTETCERRI